MESSITNKQKVLLLTDKPKQYQWISEVLNDEQQQPYFELLQINNFADVLDKKEKGNIPHIALIDTNLPELTSSDQKIDDLLEYYFSPDTAFVWLNTESDNNNNNNDNLNKIVETQKIGHQIYQVLDTKIFLCLLKEVYEQKKLKNKIAFLDIEFKRSEAYLDQAQSIAKMGSFELNLDTQSMHWSAQLYKILQKNTDERPTLDSYLACVPESDRQKVIAVLQKNSLSREQHFSIEHCLVNPDNTAKSYIVMQGKIGKQSGQRLIIGTVQDVTDYKYAKELLLQSEERYRTIFEQSQDSIFIVSSEGNFIEFNKSLLHLIGYAADEMRGVKVNNLFVDVNVYRLFEKQLTANGNVKDFELQICRKGGEVLDCMLNATQWHSIDGSVRGSHGIIRDITNQKRTQALIKAKEVAEQSAKMKEQFLANMSHEIRTPMNVVIGMAHLLENTELSNKQKEYLNALKVSSDNLVKLINNILDFSKIESGKLELEKHAFNLNELLKELIQTYKYKAREKNINLFTQMGADIPDIIIGDSVRIYQILNNLISNAIKYTNKGEVLIRCELIDETDDANIIRFSVKDTGIGIPPEKHARVFESFVQAGEETTRLFGGTGLGLSIVQKLIELHGSTIQLSSQLGQGSVFSFIIHFDKQISSPDTSKDKSTNPFAKNNTYQTKQIAVYGEPENAEYKHNVNANKNNLNGHTVHILLVEDHQLNQIVAGDLLKKWNPNIQVDIAQNGQEAILAIKKKNYDVVLMDISMPVMDGYEATTYIRKELPKPMSEVPIIAMTAHAFNKNAEQCFEVGMNDFISKPIDPNVLYSKLSKVINTFAKQTNDNKETANSSEIETIRTQLINLNYLESLTGGDEDIKQIMLETLVRDVPDELKQFKNDVNNQDWNALKASAHKLKSTCAYMGLDKTADIARIIENNAWEKKNLNDIPELAEQLLKTCYLAHQELKDELFKMIKIN